MRLGAIGEGNGGWKGIRGVGGIGQDSLWEVDRWTSDRATDCGDQVIGESYRTIGRDHSWGQHVSYQTGSRLGHITFTQIVSTVSSI